MEYQDSYVEELESERDFLWKLVRLLKEEMLTLQDRYDDTNQMLADEVTKHNMLQKKYKKLLLKCNQQEQTIFNLRKTKRR